MRVATCVTELGYGHALTRGKRYAIIEVDETKRQVKVKGDNNRSRWYPTYCFDFDNQPVIQLQLFCIDDPDDIEDKLNARTEVTIKMSNGELRWCIFKTPSLFSGSEIVPGTQVWFDYDLQHIIIIDEITDELIKMVLKHIDSQNMLVKCTLPLK